ncbi:methyltransferase family protein [Nocardia tenerifensis]|uniref:Methyltransferase family protein n=1 Tax=Nocardia tenerifensis TaxID=228006 RepID=A0A318K363_9NOCA|nr:methyltransferase family protein [Nocardia tenerifensis]
MLDVGCGAGEFAVELARRADRVDAIDRSPVMIEAAKQATPGNVTCVLGDVLEQPLPANSYDAIVSISTLHHMPLDRALPVLADALRPGGVLAVVALPRADLPRELPVEILAAAGHRVLGLAFAVLRKFGRGDWYAVAPTHDVMPVVLDPPLTTRQVRRQAAEVLPGARVRRLVYWRYALVWHKPADG